MSTHGQASDERPGLYVVYSTVPTSTFTIEREKEKIISEIENRSVICPRNYFFAFYQSFTVETNVLYVKYCTVSKVSIEGSRLKTMVSVIKPRQDGGRAPFSSITEA
jgi:hypothetical protein